MSSLQEKTAAVLALICLFQYSVSGQDNVTITFRYNETENYNFIFTERQFRGLHESCCTGSLKCGANYINESDAPNVVPHSWYYLSVYHDNEMPAFQCGIDISYKQLACQQIIDTSCLSEKYFKTQSFHLKNKKCMSKCVTFVWFHEDESIIFNVDMPDLEFCDSPFDCSSTTKLETVASSTTTRRTETTTTTPTTTTKTSLTTTPEREKKSSLSTTQSLEKSVTTITTPTSAKSSATTNGNDKDNNTTAARNIFDENNENINYLPGVIVGAVVFIVSIIIVVGVVWWKWRKKRETREVVNPYVNCSPLASHTLNNVISASDVIVKVTPSQSKETAEREKISTTPTSAPHSDYSQIDDSNAYENEDAAFSRSRVSYANSDIANKRPNEPNADAPYSTPDNIPDEPETEAIYSELVPDVVYENLPGEYNVNGNASLDGVTEQRVSAIYTTPVD